MKNVFKLVIIGLFFLSGCAVNQQASDSKDYLIEDYTAPMVSELADGDTYEIVADSRKAPVFERANEV